MRAKFGIIIAFLLLLAGAFASIEGPSKLEGKCPLKTGDEPTIAEYVLTNPYKETLEYRVTIEGIENRFTVFINSKEIKSKGDYLTVVLGPNEKATLIVYIAPCCRTRPGTYTLALKASSTKGTFSKEIKFEVLESIKISLDVEPAELTLGQCEEKEATVRIENKGPMATIMLSIEGSAKSLLSLSSEEVSIAEDSNKEVALKVKAPCKTTEAEKTASIIARIKGTEIEAEKGIKITLTDKQVVKLEKKTLEACNDVEETKTIKIRNEGRAKDKLNLSIDGPEWIKLEQTSITIEPGEEAEVSLKFMRTNKEGDFNFKIIANSVLYEKTTDEEYKVALKDCYKVAIEKSSGKEKSCLEDGKLTYKFLLKNEKNSEITLALSIEGLKGELSQREVTLRPKEEKEIIATVDISKESAGTKKLTLNASSEQFSESLTLELELEDCYALSVDTHELAKELTLEVGPQLCPQSKLLTLKTTNTGTKKQHVKVSVTGIKWIYLEPKEFELEAGKSKEFYLYISPAITEQAGDYEGLLTVEAKDYKKEFPIEVKLVAATLPEKIGVAAEAEVEETIIEQERTVKAKIKLLNTSDCPLEVLDINSEKHTVTFEPEQFTMDKNAGVEITTTIYLGKGYDKNTVELPLVILTDRGVIKKNIVINLAEETVTEVETETPAEETPKAPAGQAVAAPKIENIIVLLFLAIVAVVIVILAYYAYTKESAAESTKKKR